MIFGYFANVNTLRHLFLCLAINLCFWQFGIAQTSQNPWMAGVSGIFLDYQGLLTGDLTQYKTFDPGISIGAHAYMNRMMNVSIQSSFIPETMYPTDENNFVGTSLIDVNTLLQFKSNGTIFKEEAIFAPYISTGLGLNTATNQVRLYIPAALGFRLRLSQHFSLQFETMYKQRIGPNNIQHLAHTAGFVFALPTQQKPVKPTPKNQKESKALASRLPDTDKDGVPDRDDLCPNIKGLAMYLGCPEEDLPSEKIAAAPTAAEPVNQNNITIQDAGVDNHEDMVALEQPVTEIPVTDSEPVPQPQEEVVPNQYDGGTAERINIASADLEYLQQAMNNIYFEFGKDELKRESYTVLDTVAMILQRYPDYNLQVLGHTDNTGTFEKNQVLSVQRAFKVKSYLVYDKGIRLSRISSEGYNATTPIASNDTENGRKKNRRVEFKLIQSNGNISHPY